MSTNNHKEKFRQSLKLFLEKGGGENQGIPIDYFKRNSKDLSVDRNQASIILITSEDDATSDKIYFDVGQAHGRKFNISRDGGSVEFKISGVYVVRFEGNLYIVADSGVLEFVKTPKFDLASRAFSKFDISSGEVNKSTLLKFERGDILEVNVLSKDGSPVAVGSGTVMMLYKVE